VIGDRILFVDDELSALRGYQRVLHGEFSVSTAVGGEQGLAAIQANGPYAVVVSDMRMPGMNGAEFLARVREKAPHTVRMLLTGYADVQSAIQAVNQGNIVRFLTKPCEKAELVKAINLGLEMYRSAMAEKEMVKKAEMIGRSQMDWDTVDVQPSEEFKSPVGLPGPAQAKDYLGTQFGADFRCHVVLFKLTLFKTIEERYGEHAAVDYLKSAVKFLTQPLRPEDRMFHWSRDVLMMILSRQATPHALRQELARQTSGPHQHILEVDGKRIMFGIATTFDLLPLAQFADLDGLLEAFDAKLVAKI
jgi:response regulator RpfG family c-di-GMP phosphodiesterase